MPVTDQRERPTARGAIVDAASELMAERGFEGVRVQEVARRAGVTTGAIYAHFAGRHELLVAAIGQYEGKAEALLSAFDFDAARAADAIVAMGAGLAEDPNLGVRPFAIEALVAARREPDLADLMRGKIERARTQMEALVVRAQADGSIDADLDAASVAKWLQAMLVGVAMLAPVWEQPLVPDSWESLVRRLVAGLASSGDSSPMR